MEKRKIKYTIIGALIIVIGILSFFVYQSYAYFKVNYTRNIINTTVGDFRQSYTLASEPLSGPTETSIFWGGTITRDLVETISFTTTNEVPIGVIESWDAGLEKNGKVMAWYTDTDANGKYEVVAGAKDGVYAPENSASLFKYFQNLKILDLTNFDTSRAKNMYVMFQFAGESSTAFTLDLGDKFDTSNVTYMAGMFQNTGRNSTVFTLDLGDKFDTSKVTAMNSMFSSTGYNSPVFTLDLGDKFDTSNVTNMNWMFSTMGMNSMFFTLDLGDKFDTSKVTDMSWMFFYIGKSNPNFTLDLGNRFDTSKVTNMSSMFLAAGYSNTMFTLDLRDFNVNNVSTTDANTFTTGFSTHKIYASSSNVSFMSGKGFIGTIINCTTSPASCP